MTTFGTYHSQSKNSTIYILMMLAVVSLISAASSASAASATTVTGVRIGDHAKSTRFVLDMEKSVDFHLFMLADPYRVVVDLPSMDWNISPGDKQKAAGLIQAYRYGIFQPGTSRLVLDVNGPVAVQKSFILEPTGPASYRLVIDLVKTNRKYFMANLGKPVVKPIEYSQPVPIRRAGKKIIVIDPGHGGVDPGTISSKGYNEKSVTLKAGKELKKRLEKTGRYTVVLTRDKDFFIPLRERVRISRRADADLFISLHADSIENSKIRGATIYTLAEKSSDKEAAALAAKENKSDIIAGVDLEGESPLLTKILIDLMQRETMNYSAEFANLLIPEMGKQVKMRVNSHRFAGFRVLKAPDVPSVLVEMGYLSNRHDADMLVSKKGVEKIATSITKAVDRYFARHDALLASP
ncbi:MAG: N-acetylmuramoyl-L-alanine amidase [Alphaproteobacteria bacterium]|nr:MAG: N-acetylmuramoyl-L-alanine amidase [Alphaproteobacteria bacterium]